MDNHFTVTINDDNGVKQINLHKFVKKALLYASGFILFLILFATGTILYLNKSVDDIRMKKQSIKKSYSILEQKNILLKKSMNSTKENLLLKKKELDNLSDSLVEIQTMIGIHPDKEDLSLQERVDLTKMTSEHMATMLQLIPNGSPVAYHGITSKFGYRINPILHTKEFHRGIDLRAKLNTPIYAPADGIIEFAGANKKSGFGRLVIINHAFGFKTLYGHLNKVVVKSRRFVRKGDLIAYTGNSGLSNGPHLHYEVRYMYTALNPYWFVKWTVKNYNEIFKKEKKIRWQSLIMATANLRVQKPTQTLQLSQ